MESTHDPWPLRHLVLRTPRLELRPDDDPGLLELVEEAHRGVHPPEQMPFSYPWTDVDAQELGPKTLQHHWQLRARLHPADWSLNLLVRLDGRVIGSQGLEAKDFAVTREVHTGSWIGRRFQGNGYGTEMRAAVLRFAFDQLGATQARSDAFTDNPSSRAVSRKLGYVEDGTERRERRGEAADVLRLLVTADDFHAHSTDRSIQVDGLDKCRHMLVGPASRN